MILKNGRSINDKQFHNKKSVATSSFHFISKNEYLNNKYLWKRIIFSSTRSFFTITTIITITVELLLLGNSRYI